MSKQVSLPKISLMLQKMKISPKSSIIMPFFAIKPQGVKLTYFFGSHLAPKYFKVVANSKKLVVIMRHTQTIFTLSLGHHCTIPERLRRNPPHVGVTSGQKPCTKIIYIVLQTSVGLF